MKTKSSVLLFSADRATTRIPAYEDDMTQPVPLQLIARLAAQDPTVQLKIGVIMGADDLQIDDETGKIEG